MGNRYLKRICARCLQYRNLAWDIERKLCYDCLIEEAYVERYNTGVKS